jgi:MFS family permease
MKLSDEKPVSKYPQGFRRYISSSILGNLVLPVYSLFIPLLAAELHANPFEIGVVGGAANAVYAFMPFVMGRISDRGSARKFFIISSFAILSIVSTLYFLANSPMTLIVLRLFEGVGWAMLWPSIESSLTHNTTMDPRKVLTIFNLSWSSAAAAGPLFGAVISFALSVRDSFLLSSFVLEAALILNIVAMFQSRAVDRFDARESEPKIANSEPQFYVYSRRISPAFYVLAMVLCAISFGVMFTFFPPYGKSLGISILLIGVAPFAYGFFRFMMYLLTVKESFRQFLIKPENRVRNVLIALAVLCFSSLLITFHDASGALYIFAFALGGMGYSIVYSISLVAILAESRPEKMGASAGLFESSIGMGASSGPILAGLISGSSLSMAFMMPLLSLVVIIPAMFLVMRSGRRS